MRYTKKGKANAKAQKEKKNEKMLNVYTRKENTARDQLKDPRIAKMQSLSIRTRPDQRVKS
jgi:hypothetical protein